RRSVLRAAVAASLAWLGLACAARASGQERFGAFTVVDARDASTGARVVTAWAPSDQDGANVSVFWWCAPAAAAGLEFRRMQVLGDGGDPRGWLRVWWWFDEGREAGEAWPLAAAGQRLMVPGPEVAAFSRLALRSHVLNVRFEGAPDARPTYTFELEG